jgi:hypothetical protein
MKMQSSQKENVTKMSDMKIKSNTLKWTAGIFLFLILANIPPFKSVFKAIFDQELFNYSTADGSWMYDENTFFGRTFSLKYYTTEAFRESYPEADTIIYRNFKPNPLAFWRYSDYLFDERYTLPYFPLEEARKKRKEWKEKMKKEGRPY